MGVGVVQHSPTGQLNRPALSSKVTAYKHGGKGMEQDLLVEATANLALKRLLRSEPSCVSRRAVVLNQAVIGIRPVSCRWAAHKYLMRITEIIKPPTPDQARIKALSANKKRASDALKAERERQKRNKALQTLQTLQGSYP